MPQSNKSYYYSKYRAPYPPSILTFLNDEMEFVPNCFVADVGAGTGLFTQLLVDYGYKVYAVEPNAQMRQIAETRLSHFPNFISVEGSSEDTHLESNKFDLITVAHAFHWFDKEKAKAEFKRILKIDGKVAILWNRRVTNSTPFMQDYEKILVKYTNYKHINFEVSDYSQMNYLFNSVYKKKDFSHSQILDFDQLLGRLKSSSKFPSFTTTEDSQILTDIKDLFYKHETNGTVELILNTVVYYGRLHHCRL